MKRLAAATLCLLLASPASAAGDVYGNWVTEDRSAIVSLQHCGAGVCGRIAKVLVHRPGHPTTDVNNPDPKLRKRPVEGLLILSGFVRNGDRWDNGRIYDPEGGKSYKSKLKLNGDGSLTVSGCISVFCRSQRWVRAR